MDDNTVTGPWWVEGVGHRGKGREGKVGLGGGCLIFLILLLLTLFILFFISFLLHCEWHSLFCESERVQVGASVNGGGGGG